jgi:hypothetical protein
MRLSVAISEARVVRAPALLRWMRTAAAYWVESDEEGALYIAVFNDFPKSVEAVARLLAEADDLRDVRIALEGRPIVNRASFYESLLCYGQSFRVSSESYCRRQAMIVRDEGSCADRSCASPCWLICSTCLVRPRDQRSSFAELACHAEVEWCPRLHP